MFSPTVVRTDIHESDQIKTILNNPELYLKNLSEYKKMLELLSLNEQLTELLSSEDLNKN